MPCRLQQDHHECRTGHARQQTSIHPGHRGRRQSYWRCPRALLRAAEARSNRQREDTVVPPRLSLGPDQHHREGSGALRHRLVARLLEAHAGAGRHHQRRRHRRLLPEPVSAAPSRRVPRRPRSLRRADEGGARRRDLRDGADGLQPRPPRISSRRIPTGSRATARDSRTAPPTSTSPASTARTTTSTCPTSCARSSSARIPTDSPTTAGRARSREHLLLRPTARARSRRRPAGRCRARRTGTMPAYREWIMWSYARRIEVWELNNRVDARGRRARLHLVRHEQRLGHRAGALVPRSEGDLRRAPTS